jgi:hypothetical protein
VTLDEREERSAWQRAAERLARKARADLDQLILEELNLAVGHFKLADLHGRLTAQRTPTGECYYLDGRPLVEFSLDPYDLAEAFRQPYQVEVRWAVRRWGRGFAGTSPRSENSQRPPTP